MKLYKLAFIPFAFLAVACGEDGTSIDLNGKTPEQQAETVADAVCTAEVACGDVSYEISEDGKTVTCTATIEDIDYAECVAETEPDVLETFETCEFSDADLATIEACFNTGVPCVSQAQADADCAAIEAGEEPEEQEIPQVCQDMLEIIQACQSPQ